MAIIKPENYRGEFPYWWEIHRVLEDRFNNISKVTISLYSSPEAYQQNRVDNILYEIALDVPGLSLSNSAITNWAVANHPRFKDGTDTDDSYILSTYKSTVWLDDPNLDTHTGLKRSLEVIWYKPYLNASMMVMMIRVHFYDNIQVNNPNFVPKYDEDGITLLNPQDQYITQSAAEYNPILDRDFAWIVDDFYNVPIEMTGGATIGEFTFFKSLKLQGLTDEQVLTQGLQYGLAQGYVDKRLYGN